MMEKKPVRAMDLTFNDNQVKSATGNSGKFDASKPSILLSKGTNQEVRGATVNGDEFGNDDLDINTWRSNARNYANENNKGEWTTNIDTGWEIKISKVGINESLQHSANREQIQSIHALPILIKNGIHVYSEKNYKTKDAGTVRAYHYFLAPIQIGRNIFTAQLVVRETNMGEMFYDHDLTKIEKTDSALLSIRTKFGDSNTEPGFTVNIQTSLIVSRGSIQNIVCVLAISTHNQD